MPRRKKKKMKEAELEPATSQDENEEEEPQLEKVDFGVSAEEMLPEYPKEEKIEEDKPKSNLVTVEVVKGSLRFDDVSYVKGQTFQTTRERALSIDPQFVEIHS